MRCFLPIQFLVVAGILYPQQPAPPGGVVSPPAQEEKELCKLEGRTVNALTGAPVRRVKLTLRSYSPGGSSAGATSGAEGQFSFGNIKPGTYRLLAERTGFVRQAYGSRSFAFSGTPLTLLPGQDIKDLEFKLTPHGVITGKVLDDEGEPVERASVNAYRQRDYGGRLRQRGVGNTNDIGEFRIANLSPGRYFVGVRYRGSLFGREADRPQPEEPEESFVPTFYPGATDLGGAAPIEVGAGQEVSGIEITLRKERVYRVQGRIVGATPAQFRNLDLMLTPRKRDETVMFLRGSPGRVKADGSFEIMNVQPGAYHLVVMLGSDESVYSPVQRVPVEVMDNNVKGLVVRLNELLEVTGVVRVEGQEKVTFDRTRIALRAAEESSFGRSAPVNEDGTFKMEGVFPDKRYLSFFQLPEGTYVKSVRMGNQEVLEKGLDLSQMQSAPAIEVILSPKAGTVEGSVQEEEEPAPGSRVTLIPDPVRPEQRYLSKSATADQNGRFSIKGVAPGDYKLYAWREYQVEILREPELLKPFEHRAVEVSVQENSREQVELTVLKPEDAQRR